MSILKKIWTELTRVRSIEFKSFETTEEKEIRYRRELQKKITEIQVKNYKKIMSERLIPFVKDLELSETGLLLSDHQLFARAHNLFLNAKSHGKLDKLNNIITEVTE